MSWPEKPTCHVVNPIFKFDEPHWRAPRNEPERGQSEPYRTCSYCGSMHPEDLVRLIETESRVKLGGSDWKYGWPHKFYVDVPNLTPGIQARIGTRSTSVNGVIAQEPIMGTSPAMLMAKFYNEHLLDDGYGDAERAKLFALLTERTGIEFNIDPEKGLGYKAPYRGYQR